MDIKANIPDKKGGQTAKVAGQPNLKLIQEAAERQAGFLITNPKIPIDETAKFAVFGVKKPDAGVPYELSYALKVNDKVYGVYRVLPASKKGKKPVRSKKFGTIKGEMQLCDLENGFKIVDTIKGI